MAISREWKEEIVEKLSAAGMLRVKAMFGGLGFYLDDVFFAAADDDVLYFKTDAINSPDYAARGMKAFDPMGNGKPMQYHQLPQDVLNDPKELLVWIDKACDAARRKDKKRAKH